MHNNSFSMISFFLLYNFYFFFNLLVGFKENSMLNHSNYTNFALGYTSLFLYTRAVYTGTHKQNSRDTFNPYNVLILVQYVLMCNVLEKGPITFKGDDVPQRFKNRIFKVFFALPLLISSLFQSFQVFSHQFQDLGRACLNSSLIQD